MSLIDGMVYDVSLSKHFFMEKLIPDAMEKRVVVTT